MSIRQRMIVGGGLTAVVFGSWMALYASGGGGQPATELQIEDTANILYAPDLEAAIKEIEFHEPTTVAVFTHRGGEEALYDDYALNDATLAYAKSTRPDWLSDNKQKWADDLFILAVDPEGRLVGTYFGENRKVSTSVQEDIQEATKSDYRIGQWTDGTIAGLESAAEHINKPVTRSGGFMVLGNGLSIGTAIGSIIYVGAGLRRQGRSKDAREAGDEAMASVVADYEVTEVHANLIPEDSRYGWAMLGRYEEYTKKFRKLTELGNTARGIPEKDYDQPQALNTLTDYQEAAQSLDELDDVIADTAALLNLDQAWPQAWERQVSSLRTDLEGIDKLLSETLDAKMRGLTEGAALRPFAAEALHELDRLHTGLDRRTVSPDDALDGVREIRDALSAHLDSLAQAIAREYAEDASERTTMTTAMRRARVNTEPTILSTVDHTWTWITINSFNEGHSSGVKEVNSSRVSSSSSSTSGYSSSGGSFSGAGSSSRF